MTWERWALSVSNRPANKSFAFPVLSGPEPARNSFTDFSASSSGVFRADSLETNALTFASSFHRVSASSSAGPAQTAASEISGTLACVQGQSG